MRYILLSLTVILSFLCANGRTKPQAEQKNGYSAVQKLGYAEQIIEKFYVDTVDSDKIVETAIIAMLKTLDPHSSYTNARETKDLTVPLQGNFSGIGIQFNLLNDTLYVIQTTVGGPSEKVGVQPGDRILSANDSILSGVKRVNSDILNILRGPKGTEVLISVQRKGVPEPIKFRIIRDDIPLNSVDASYLINDSIGYVKVSRFAEQTGKEVAEALYEMRKKGVKNIIIDLQDNGGGYLNSAVQLSELFLNKGDLVVYTDGPHIDRADYFVEDDPLMNDGRLVVLVNQYSASASEIFAGAVQDNDRGIIVGRRTFGKGLVQRPFTFPDGSMIRLTVSRYFTPSGRSIQKPYDQGDGDEYYLDIYNRYKHGEFQSADSVKFDDGLKTYTLNNGRTVYGGGGIMPDVFVPIDTTGYSDYYRDLLANGIINRFVIEYVDRNREGLNNRFNDESQFINEFDTDGEILTGLIELAEENGVHYNESEFNTSKTVIGAIIKGLIARDLWDMNGYYQAVNDVINPTFVKGLEIISTPELYEEILEGIN